MAEAGSSKPHGLPLRFSNLSVTADSRKRDELVPTLGSTVTDAIVRPLTRLREALGSHKHGKAREVELVSGVEGIVEQGEMLLVLGPPSAQTSTLLRALSLSGDLRLARPSHLDFGLLPPSAITSYPRWLGHEGASLRGEVVYMSEQDAHFATLSLRASMEPCALAKTPEGQDGSAQLDTLAGALGLGHALDTHMGSSLVQGLSGGERKRASVLEALLTRASVLLLDSPINGLDSTTASRVITKLKALTQESRRTLVATTPHISEPLFKLFDKVLVLNSQGRQIYFGPTRDAQAYFEGQELNLKRNEGTKEGVPEFIVGCASDARHQRELEQAWLRSEMRSRLQGTDYEERYAFEKCARPLMAAIRAEKHRFTPRTSPFTVSLPRQVALLTKRQLQLIKSELPAYVTKTSVNLALSVLVGTLFLQMPQTTGGAFTRQSLLLLSIMFNAYLSLAELGKAIEGRDIVKRQSDWGFFSTGTVAAARVIGDLPLIGVQVLLFGSVTYLLAGLQRSWPKFGVYILFVYATALNLSSMFRMFAAFSPSFEQAIRYCGLTLNILVVYAGLFVATPSMQPWLRWIHYIVDPIARAYEAVLSNEFHHMELECSPEHIIPSGPSYIDARYQTCAMPGSEPGKLSVSGDAYLVGALDFHHKITEDLLVMVAQCVVFLIVTVVATEYLHFAPQGSKRVWARTKSARRRLLSATTKDLERSVEGEVLLDNYAGGSDDASTMAMTPSSGGHPTALPHTSGATLIWRDVSLWVDTPTETRKLLDRVSGYAEPGVLTCLIGPSGAGKSTLLNALAGRQLTSIVKGSITLDGEKLNESMYGHLGYVEQFDMHDEKATVREALEFSAVLRQHPDTPYEEKMRYVELVMDLLGISHLSDAIIGTPTAGLNSEQRKLVSIAVEVVSRPAVLFCDEPTTSLDSKSALRVINVLHRLSRAGLAVLATVHQPSSELFARFDRALILKTGGRQIYFGHAHEALPFLCPVAGVDISQSLNSADTLLDIASVVDEDGLDSVMMTWRQSRECQALCAVLDDMQRDTSRHRGASVRPSLPYQAWIVTCRLSRHLYRDPTYSYTKFFTATAVSLIVGLTFFQLGNTAVSFQNRMFSVFLVLFIPPVFMNLMIFKMFALRGMWTARERPTRSYGVVAFCTSLIASEIPYSIACGTVYFALWYFLAGLPLDSMRAGYTYAMVQLFFFFQSTWAMWITALAPGLGTIANLLPFFLVAMECFNGSLMPYPQMPVYWRWLYWVSPFQWYVKGILGVISHDVPVHCSPDELVTFEPPPSQTCASYMADFLRDNAGYLVNPDASAACGYCKWSTGDDFTASLGIGWSDRWLSLGIVGLYTALNVVLVYVLIYFPPHRLSLVRGKRQTTANALEEAERQWEAEELRRWQESLGEARVI